MKTHWIVMAGIMLGIAACGGGGGGSGDARAICSDGVWNDPDLAGSALEVMAARPDLSTVKAAFEGGGSANMLRIANDCTFFAPTDAAFDAWFAEMGITREQALAQSDMLWRTMHYHVLAGGSPVARLPYDRPTTSVENKLMKIANVATDGYDVRIFDGFGREAAVVEADIPVANGAMHVIDRVLLPSDKVLADVIATRSELTTFAAMLDATNVDEALKLEGQQYVYTAFAPVDSAFEAWFANRGITREQALADNTLMREIVSLHLVLSDDPIYAVDFSADTSYVTGVSGARITPDTVAWRVTDPGGTPIPLIAIDGLAKNGTVHTIDGVMQR